MYSCHNKPRPSPDTSEWAQDGWFDDQSGMTRKPKMVRVKSAFDCSLCTHEESAADPKCDGCQWRKS